MKDNGCAIVTISIPILIVLWLLLHPLWVLFFGVSAVTVVNSKQEFEEGDEIGWDIYCGDETCPVNSGNMLRAEVAMWTSKAPS